MTESGRWRVAVVGTGFMGSVHVRSARLAGAQVVGVAASTPARAAGEARRLGLARGYGSAAEAVTDTTLDAVHVCTPNDLHAPLTRAALEAGLHVVCEKPVATSAADAEDLRKLATHSGRVVAVPFVYRYHAMARQARSMVAAGELGDVRLVHGTYLQDWLMEDTDTNWRVEPARGGPSRAFADIGSHWCDLAEFVTGERLRVHGAQSRAFAPGRETEDAVVLSLATGSGAIGSVVVSQVSPGRKNRLWLEVDGARRSLVFSQEEPNRLWVGARAETRVLERDAGVLHADAARLSLVPAGHPQGYLDCFDAFVADAYAAMRGEPVEALPTVVDGVRAVSLTEDVLEECRRSNR
ncbi:MAG: Gfo/Idh/MocA family oxidoreductase [Actinomycetota bacterium]|nr:Gfo/Idh/MocA family oxidoreductase [Actinomycetota bacterium]